MRSFKSIGAEAQRQLRLAASEDQIVAAYVSFASKVASEMSDKALAIVLAERLDAQAALRAIKYVYSRVAETLQPSDEDGLSIEWRERIGRAASEAVEKAFWERLDQRLDHLPILGEIGGVQ